MNLFIDQDPFVNRKSISNYRNKIVDDVKKINIDDINFTDINTAPQRKIIEKQKEYFWMRLYLEDLDTTTLEGDSIRMIYNEKNEEIEVTFACYAKLGSEVDKEQNIINYESKNNNKVLCIMVDVDKINYKSDNIKFIRSLFKLSRWYRPQLIRTDDFTFINNRTSLEYKYYDIDF